MVAERNQLKKQIITVRDIFEIKGTFGRSIHRARTAATTATLTYISISTAITTTTTTTTDLAATTIAEQNKITKI